MANETQAPAPSPALTLTVDQLKEVIREVSEQNRMNAEDYAKATGAAVAEASQKTRQWWDDRNYPHVSVYNPQGERDHPRPKLTREIFWLGYHCQEAQHTREEIELLNRLRPGSFPLRDGQGVIQQHNFFKIRERDPGLPNSPLMVEFPCLDLNDRMKLARFDQGRGAVDLLLELVPKLEPATAG